MRPLGGLGSRTSDLGTLQPSSATATLSGKCTTASCAHKMSTCPHNFQTQTSTLPAASRNKQATINPSKSQSQNKLPRDNMMDVMNLSQPLGFGFGLSGATMGSAMSAHKPAHRSLQEMVETSGREVNQADVICGRDKMSHAHPGNKRFRHIVMMYRGEYQSAPSREIKTNITCKIVSMIKECGGRFLKQDEENGDWKQVGDHYAREKVSHALRSAKDPNRPKPKKRRELKKYVPTPEEDALFEATLADQQRIFDKLVASETTNNKDAPFEIDLDNLESLLSGI